MSHTIKLRRDADYPNFVDKFYIDQGIVVSVGGFHKPSRPKLAGLGVKSKATIKPKAQLYTLLLLLYRI